MRASEYSFVRDQAAPLFTRQFCYVLVDYASRDVKRDMGQVNCLASSSKDHKVKRFLKHLII